MQRVVLLQYFVPIACICYKEITIRAPAEYPATVLDSTCAHIFKEREMRMDELTQVTGYSAVKQNTIPR